MLTWVGFSRKQTEAETCMQVVYWRALSGTAPAQRPDRVKGEGSCRAAATDASTGPTGSSNTGCPRLSQLRDYALVPP